MMQMQFFRILLLMQPTMRTMLMFLKWMLLRKLREEYSIVRKAMAWILLLQRMTQHADYSNDGLDSEI